MVRQSLFGTASLFCVSGGQVLHPLLPEATPTHCAVGRRQRTLRFYKMKEPETHNEIIGPVQSGKVDLRTFYDLVLPMADASEAFGKLAAREAAKAVPIMSA